MNMRSRNCRPATLNCEVIVHGNGFLANVKLFDMSYSGSQPIGPEALKPGDSIRLEIEPAQGGRLTVQRGLVRWTNGDIVGIKVLLMETDDQRTIDEVAWSYARGELALYRWFRRRLQGDTLSYLRLSFAPAREEAQVSRSEAA
jgi:hypothetical protein